jgi:hypothetical protein
MVRAIGEEGVITKFTVHKMANRSNIMCGKRCRYSEAACIIFLCCLISSSFRNPIANRSVSEADNHPTETSIAVGDFELARSQSYGFFDDIPARSWNLYRDIYLRSENHMDPMNPLADSEFIANVTPVWKSVPATWYQNNYEPNFSCAFEKRIGGINTNGDGPKWVRQVVNCKITRSPVVMVC